MKHPMGTYLISITESFEKFSYFIFTGTIILYMYEVLHFSVPFSTFLYGLIVGGCFFFQIITGYITDRYIGNRKSIIIGEILMTISQLIFTYAASFYYLTESTPTHSTLLFNFPEMIFIIGSIFMAIGASFIKISVTSFIGLFYENNEGQLDNAYALFYMISNIGAFLAPLVLSVVVGIGYPHLYQYGFFIGAMTLFIGLMIFLIFRDKCLNGMHGEKVGVKPISQMIEEKLGKMKKTAHDAKLSKVDIDRIKVIFLILLVFIFFYIDYEQVTSSIVIMALKYGDNLIPFTSITVPPQFYISLNPLFILILSPIFIKLMPFLNKRNKEPSSLGKLGIGMLSLAFSYLLLQIPVIFLNGQISMIWMILYNLFLSIGELLVVAYGLSLISKLAPIQYRSLFMGILFAATAIAKVLAGIFAGALPTHHHKSHLLLGLIQINSLSSFLWIFIILAGLTGIIWILSKNRIQKLMHGII